MKIFVTLKMTLLILSMLVFSISLLAQIEGDVTDQNNKGIANAVITATDYTGKLIDTAVTDKRGFYFFKTLKSGKYNIEAKAAGYISLVFKNVEVEKESNMTSEWDDTYYAVRLDIILKLTKSQK
jgi:hypothetical protein